jgi:hypothetical protein
MYSVNMAGYYNVANDRTIAPEIETYFSPGRYPAVAQALMALGFLAIRDLEPGQATGLAVQMGLIPPAINLSVKRGEGIVRKKSAV